MKFLLLILLFSSIYADDIIWPLKKSQTLSATFGEFRPNHFHAGIDIKTFGQIGIPVRSVSFGNIIRTKISKRGYGKVVYIKNDGFYSIYAHLNAFENSRLGLNDRTDSLSLKLGRKYPIDIIYSKKDLLVKPGDVIGFSGETGVGFPHLHFELRENDDVPINPLKSHLTIIDNKPPDIQSLLIIPLSYKTLIDGYPLQKEYKVLMQKKGYQLTQIPEIQGDFLLKLNCYDSQDINSSNKLGIYKIEVFEDNRKVYGFSFDKFSYNDYKKVGLIYDLKYSGLSPTNYCYNLNSYIDKNVFNKLVLKSYPAVKKSGKRKIKIIVYDNSGNSSVLNVYLKWSKPQNIYPEVTISYFKNKSVILNCYFKTKILKNIKKVFFSYYDGKKWEKEFESIITKENYFKANFPYLNNKNVLYRIRIRDKFDNDHYIIKHTERKILSTANRIISDKIYFYNDGYIAKFRGQNPFGCIINNDYKFISSKNGDFGYICRKYPEKFVNNTYNFIFNDGGTSSAKVKFPVYNVDSLKFRKIRFFENTLNVDMYKNSLYKKTYIACMKYKRNNTDFPILYNSIILEPQYLPLNRPAKVSFLVKPFREKEKIGIFKFNNTSNYWSYLRTKVVKNKVSAYITSFNPLAVFVDNIYPDASFHEVHYDNIKEELYIKLFVTDKGKGINESKIKLTIDSINFSKGEYDPDRRTYSLIEKIKLVPGKYKISAYISDLANNKITRHYMLHIK